MVQDYSGDDIFHRSLQISARTSSVTASKILPVPGTRSCDNIFNRLTASKILPVPGTRSSDNIFNRRNEELERKRRERIIAQLTRERQAREQPVREETVIPPMPFPVPDGSSTPFIRPVQEETGTPVTASMFPFDKKYLLLAAAAAVVLVLTNKKKIMG